MYEKDGIVYADSNENLLKVKSVKTEDDYILNVRFSNGVEKRFDVKKIISKGIFSKLKNVNLFNSAFVDYGTVVWDGGLDISPEYLYENGEYLGELKYE
ncbi:MAG: DUF2442 domain-containing protein [Anaerovoracaceae bacterium]